MFGNNPKEDEVTRYQSIEVYRRIEAEGLLSKRRLELYQLLYEYGPCSSSELFEHYKGRYKPQFSYNANVHSRLNEMREQGAVFEVQPDYVCKIKGNHVILWDVTDKIPVKFKREPKASHKELLARIEFLENQLRAAQTLVTKVEVANFWED